ncbi:MAG: catalase/peroxidase HPI [Lachnospiraceae bacterium]|nr:catalase/peroxidase HPI [Lachnospiraceae bacterium]
MAESKCPVTGMGGGKRPDFTKGTTNKDWWPDMLDLKVLAQNSALSNPMGGDFDYIEAFKTLDLQEVKDDLYALMTNSQDWWPADYGHYGPFFIRMAWHSAGTYRTGDGRGGARDGTQRFAPLGSWPDNVNLDKARRLIWPIKQKYGRKLSWADLMILAGNVAIESMGLPLCGFGGGREDVWEPQEDIYWGNETVWLDDSRYDKSVEKRQLDQDSPLAAVQMGLIYVNPEGPNGEPLPMESAKDVRETFGRMAMNDEETVALIAGGHTFGKAHGAADPNQYVGPEPEGAPIEQQGLGWKSTYGAGHGNDSIGSGIEGAWKAKPTEWNMGYLHTLLKYDWELTKSPAGAYIWLAVDVAKEDMVVPPHGVGELRRPMMTTADLSLKYDPIYKKICENYLANPDEFAKAFTRAWFKLTHRDMGPKSLYFGADVPEEDFIWQDPIPRADYVLTDADVTVLKEKIASAGLSVSQLVKTAWAAAASFRGSDKRGGANGGRIRLEPQIGWEVNEPEKLKIVLAKYEAIKKAFDCESKIVSIADLVVLGGNVGIEMAAKKAGVDLVVPFLAGRTDADDAQTDALSFNVLEPVYDGFRNYLKRDFATVPEKLLVDRAQLLTLTAPEMTVLIGGLRVLGNNYQDSELGVFTNKPETLTNDFFINLMDMATEWKATDDKNVFAGVCRKSGSLKWKASRVDLIFGSNSQLRGLAEVYACDDAKEKFVADFVAAWNKVMQADRFDLR